jgi:hypothetical protein
MNFVSGVDGNVLKTVSGSRPEANIFSFPASYRLAAAEWLGSKFPLALLLSDTLSEMGRE